MYECMNVWGGHLTVSGRALSKSKFSSVSSSSISIVKPSSSRRVADREADKTVIIRRYIQYNIKQNTVVKTVYIQILETEE